MAWFRKRKTMGRKNPTIHPYGDVIAYLRQGYNTRLDYSTKPMTVSYILLPPGEEHFYRFSIKEDDASAPARSALLERVPQHKGS